MRVDAEGIDECVGGLRRLGRRLRDAVSSRSVMTITRKIPRPPLLLYPTGAGLFSPIQPPYNSPFDFSHDHDQDHQDPRRCASTTSRTSTSRSRATSSSSSPGCRARANPRSRSTPSTPRGSGSTWNRSPRTPGSSSTSCRSRTSTRSKGCRRRSRSSSVSARSNPRSTVATTTEIYDYLRVLFARAGTPHCWECGREIASQSPSQIVDAVMKYPPGTKVMILSPLIRGQKGEHKDIFGAIHKQGFVRARVDGEIIELPTPATFPELKKTFAHNIEAVVDRIVLKPEIRSRLADSIETALKLSQGLVIVAVAQRRRHLDRPGLQREVRLPRCIPNVSPAGARAAAVQLQLARTAPAPTATAWGRSASSTRS